MRVLFRMAWRNIGRHRRRSVLTASAMAVGVAMSLAMVALSDGMYEKMLDTAVRLEMGHVQVHDPAYPKQRALHETLPEQPVVSALDGVEDAAGVSPRLMGYALLGAGDRSAGVSLTGVVPEREARVTLVADNVRSGKWLGDAPENGILLGKGLAETLEVGVGGEVVAVTQAADGSLGNDLYTVTGVFETGAAMLDRTGAFLHLADLQSLLALEGQVHEVALLARDRVPADTLADEVRAALPHDVDTLVQTWKQIDPSMSALIQTQDVSVWVLLGIVFAVAAFGVLNTMLMSVFERVRELGVLRAIGLKPSQLMVLVLIESVLLALLGGLAGVALGLGLDGLLVAYGIDLSAFTSGYTFAGVAFEPVLRGVIVWSRFAEVVGALGIVAILASLWPAARAARLNPVQAMRET